MIYKRTEDENYITYPPMWNATVPILEALLINILLITQAIHGPAEVLMREGC
jgi:hypothetical protein